MKIHFLALGLLLVTGCSNVQGQPNPNLALGKKFVSSDPNTRNWGEGLTDGSWKAGRGTTYATNDTVTFPKTVTVDLEEAKSLGYVALGVPPFGSTKTISVSLSTDGVTFTEVGRNEFAPAEEKKHLFTFPPTSARYIRLTYLDHHPKSYRYQPTFAFTTELEAYAPGTAPVLPATPAAPATPATAAPATPEPADVAAPKVSGGAINKKFAEMHESFLKRGKEGPIGVLFIGDSITDFWRRPNAAETWARFSSFNPANFGIGGDKTQHVLWRIENGELDGINPKVVVLMIGTNNTALYPAEEIIKADKKIVAEIHRRLPDAKLLLLGIFPRGATAAEPKRAKIKAVNAELAKLDDGNKTRYLDIGDKFLEADGSISKEVMPDALHPSPKGYEIWADAMTPLLTEMMK